MEKMKKKDAVMDGTKRAIRSNKSKTISKWGNVKIEKQIILAPASPKVEVVKPTEKKEYVKPTPPPSEAEKVEESAEDVHEIKHEIKDPESVMKAINSTIQKFSAIPGVLGTIVTTLNGEILTSSLDSPTLLQVGTMASRLVNLCSQCVTDLDGDDQLELIRCRTNKHNLFIVPEAEFVLVLVKTAVE
jgi:predicted regulator of Ras-like GTPase activity (Roadblock/LC7/MglB family)